MSLKSTDFLLVGKTAAQAADDKKANHIHFLDLRQISSMAHYFLILSVDSRPQSRAVVEEIDTQVKKNWHIDPIHIEKAGHSDQPQWTVMDYGGLVIHLMDEEARTFYNLERLWEDSKPLDWKAPAPKPRKKAVKKKAAAKKVTKKPLKKKKKAASKKRTRRQTK